MGAQPPVQTFTSESFLRVDFAEGRNGQLQGPAVSLFVALLADHLKLEPFANTLSKLIIMERFTLVVVELGTATQHTTFEKS